MLKLIKKHAVNFFNVRGVDFEFERRSSIFNYTSSIMGQKVHPLGFRIGVTQTHRSQWFAKPKDYANLVKEDLIIREYVAQNLANAGISRLNISRQVDRIEIEFFTARPRALVGTKGEALVKVREALKKRFQCTATCGFICN